MSADEAERPRTDADPDPAELMKMALDQESLYHSDGSLPGGVDPERVAALLPEFEILELVGQGGMGSVFRARQKKLDREVAIKVLPPEIAGDPAFAERFQREARTLARLSHPHIVTIHDFGEVEGLYYLVMEFVAGVDLRKLMEMGRLSPEEALRIVPQICDALQFAHENGVVHRDIKPGNVLIDQQGFVRVADFGLARILGQDPDAFTLTMSQQRLGTPHYMAPEQIEEPSRVDHRADIFSLGVVFYEMLTGRLPRGRFDPPSSQSSVGRGMDEAVLKSLETEPARRYQAARAMKQEVEAAWKQGFDAGARQGRPETSAEAGHAAASAPKAPSPEVSASEVLPDVDSRLSLMALSGFLWLVIGGGSFLVMYLGAVSIDHPSPNSVQPGEPDVRIATLSVILATGLLGGPLLGGMAVNRIRQSRGRLYGLGLAVFTAGIVPLLFANALVVGLVGTMVAHQGFVGGVGWRIMMALYAIMLVVDGAILAKVTRRLAGADGRRPGAMAFGTRVLWFVLTMFAMIALVLFVSNALYGDRGY